MQGSVKKEGGDEKPGIKGEDEDAINSDLDSSEDELDEEAELAGGGDDQGGDIVIALYEKVSPTSGSLTLALYIERLIRVVLRYNESRTSGR